MSSLSTYSFLDLTGNIAHSSVGAFNFVGEGLGELSISMATDRTVHDVAADSSVMVSKIAGSNGTITIQTQQASSLHKWLILWYNYLSLADSDEWAKTAVLVRASKMGITHLATGVSPQKIGDTPYQAQGQRVSWILMAADIQTLPL
jgi:hypothetical protein